MRDDQSGPGVGRLLPRRRALLGIASVLVVCVAAAVSFVVIRNPGPNDEPLDALHATTTAPAPSVLSRFGPSAGDLVADWTVRLDAKPNDVRFELVGGQILAASPTGIDAFDSSTGARRWYLRSRHPLPDEYWFPHVSGHMVTLNRVAPGRPDLWTRLDLVSGRVVSNSHTRPSGAVTAPPPETAATQTLPGGLRLTNGNGVAVDDASGRNLVTLPDYFTLDDELGVRSAGGYLLIPGQDAKLGSDRQYLAVLDTRTRRTRILAMPPIRALDTDGRRAYAVVRSVGDGAHALARAYGLLPAAVRVIDMATGTSDGLLPLPEPGGTVIAPLHYPYWIRAVGGHLIFAARDEDGPSPSRVDLTSVSVGGAARPLSLAGVSPRDWPDACGLASRYRTVVTPYSKPAKFGDASLRRVNCDYVASKREKMTVSIVWVAPTPQQAHTLMVGLPDGRPQHLGDEAISYPPGDIANSLTAVRVGRVIVLFHTNLRRATPDTAAQHFMKIVVSDIKSRS